MHHSLYHYHTTALAIWAAIAVLALKWYGT
jgi:hypothetical protein